MNELNYLIITHECMQWYRTENCENCEPPVKTKKKKAVVTDKKIKINRRITSLAGLFTGITK